MLHIYIRVNSKPAELHSKHEQPAPTVSIKLS